MTALELLTRNKRCCSKSTPGIEGGEERVTSKFQYHLQKQTNSQLPKEDTGGRI